MKKQDILSECARRCGDEDAGFKALLSATFDYVLLELAQEECLPMLRRQTSFQLNNAACVASGDGLLRINTQSLLSLPVGSFPDRLLDDLLVPAWGMPLGRIRRVDDATFVNTWLANGAGVTGRALLFRVFPHMGQLELWPAPSAEFIAATCLMSWLAPPATLTDNADITEISLTDIPTILAGLYRHGIEFRDETLNNRELAEGRWLQGVQLMKSRQHRALNQGRKSQIVYRDF